MKYSDPQFERNLGFLSAEEQAILNGSTVAIAGAGGDGGLLAVQLARLGVGGIRLADPDPFEAENINRQACSTVKTNGENKAEVVGRFVNDINPDIEVELFTEGVTADNVERFVAGSDLVIDETEFTIHTLGVMIARAAREEGVPNLMAMNIGFGATVTTFKPGSMSFEKMLGLSETAPLEELAGQEPKVQKWLPYVPPYGDLAVFEKVAKNEKSAPSIAPGVAMAAGIASTQSMLNLIGTQNNRPGPVVAPKVLVMDAMTGQSKTIKMSALSHYRHILPMALRSSLGINPKTSY